LFDEGSDHRRCVVRQEIADPDHPAGFIAHRFDLLGEGFFEVYFRDVEIGEFDAEELRFRPA
jgi:hypothetical protein